jgi:hypothetical protein
METTMRLLKIALAAGVALATCGPAFAQDQPAPYQPTPQYQRDVDRYQDAQDNYRADRADYDARRADYDRARADYDARRERYEADRARYDARYGEGAYARYYGPAPAWNANAYSTPASDNDRRGYDDTARRDFDRRAREYEDARARYDQRYGDGAYARAYGAPPVWSGPSNDAARYGRDTAYANPCYQSTSKDTVAGAGIGALLGAALGSNVAAHGRRTEGTVLGALVGAGIGGAVGNAHAKAANAKCDQAGLYFDYADTFAYRESSDDRRVRSGQYDYRYYARRGCRLAAAPINDRDEVRYVRVCPDSDGRYRVTS